jgi:hypothetical protein
MEILTSNRAMADCTSRFMPKVELPKNMFANLASPEGYPDNRKIKE